MEDAKRFMKTKAFHYWSLDLAKRYKVGRIPVKRIPVHSIERTKFTFGKKKKA